MRRLSDLDYIIMEKQFETADCLRGFCAKGCGRQDKQLNTYDYLADVPGNAELSDMVEVQFKNTRKGYYRNDNHLDLAKGDIVAVESSPGHDIGVVTLTGQLVPLQMKKANLKPDADIKRVYRKARDFDIDKWKESKALEEKTMIRSRQIAKDLELDMKIGDVEYQGDGNKAIFYYIADQRVDFRKLIKVLAEEFHVRIEMKQIGARQEAGRIGGIGLCGRELCCATWLKNFNSVSTTAVRVQDISPNPQKLAGQCAKLKCCLNYEVDTYMEASQQLPDRRVALETADGTFFFFKADILAGLVTYSTDKRLAANLTVIPVGRAKEIMEMNKRGEKPIQLEEQPSDETKRPVDLVEQESLTRFDRSHNKRRGRRNKPAADRTATADSPRKTEGRVGAPAEKRQTSSDARPAGATDADRRAAPHNSHRPRPDRRNNRPRGNQDQASQASDNHAPTE